MVWTCIDERRAVKRGATPKGEARQHCRRWAAHLPGASPLPAWRAGGPRTDSAAAAGRTASAARTARTARAAQHLQGLQLLHVSLPLRHQPLLRIQEPLRARVLRRGRGRVGQCA